MRDFRQVGVILNANKTKVLMTEAQPPSQFCIFGAEPLEIIARERRHKWLGCIFVGRKADVDSHLQMHFGSRNGFYARRNSCRLIVWVF